MSNSHTESNSPVPGSVRSSLIELGSAVARIRKHYFLKAGGEQTYYTYVTLLIPSGLEPATPAQSIEVYLSPEARQALIDALSDEQQDVKP